MSSGRTARIGVDIGGTFTDLVLLASDGDCFFRKVSSTPAAPEAAVLDGVYGVLDEAGISPDAVTDVLHGTTVGSNTLLQRVGARAMLLATRGFRDVLEIGRVRTPDMFDLSWDKPKPLIARRHRLEVDERVRADGTVLKPVPEGDIAAAADHARREGIETVAICFLNSYANPENERRAAEMFRALCPDIPVSASVDILPEMREYERTSTTAVNAYVLPKLQTYLRRLEAGLREIGLTAPLLVANSNGGLASARMAQERPAFFISSGRSAGVAGAARLGASIEEPDLIAFDMGGTTASASLIAGGALSRTNEYEFRSGISTPSRFIKAGGYLMRVPAVDVAEVGSGAGSIAWIDDGGLLNVGPVSAGADPGPACYGQGGVRPTVTDANAILGFLPTTLAGGALKLDLAAAEATIAKDLAEPLRLSVEEAAFGVREVANANMARAIRTVTVERGVDPRDFALLAFGGSGPAHAADLARMLEIPRIIAPRAPGVFTAMGMLAGSVERHSIRAVATPLAALQADRMATLAADLAAECRDALAMEGYGPDRTTVTFEMDLCFTGQDSEVSVPILSPETAFDPDGIRAAFLAAYEDLYGYASTDSVDAVSLRALGRGMNDQMLDFRTLRSPEFDRPADVRAAREVLFGRDAGRVSTPVVDRTSFSGASEGPLILESSDATLVVPPDAAVHTDAAGDIVITLR